MESTRDPKETCESRTLPEVFSYRIHWALTRPTKSLLRNLGPPASFGMHLKHAVTCWPEANVTPKRSGNHANLPE